MICAASVDSFPVSCRQAGRWTIASYPAPLRGGADVARPATPASSPGARSTMLRMAPCTACCMRCRPGDRYEALVAKVPDLRCTADALHRVRDTSDHARQAYSFSRRDSARALPTTTPFKKSSPPQKGGEAPKGACQPCAAQHQQTSPLADVRRQVYAVCATHLLRGCAPYGARSPSGASTAALAGTPIPAQLQAMLPGTWTARDPEKPAPDLIRGGYRFSERSRAAKEPAGVTRPILSQSSDSTSRLGRNTEGNDAQSRPGAGCKPARRHRTRSASESALAKASLDERDDLAYLI